MRTVSSIFLLLLMLVPQALMAQRTKLITSENGLSNSLINKVCQDSYGYIWIATEDGLNRYDGQNMTVYRKEDGRSNLMDNYVHSVFEDHAGTVWVGGLMGLQHYNRQNNSFVDVPCIVNGDTVAAHITCIVEDNMYNVWVATSGRGLMRVDNDVAQACNKFAGISDVDYISSVLVDVRGYLWIVAHKNGIFRCNIESNEVIRVSIDGNLVLPENAQVCQSGDHIYLNLFDAGLFVFDPQSNSFLESGFRAPDVARSVPVSTVCSLGDKFLVGTDGNGLFVFDQATKTTRRVDYYVSQMDFRKSKIHSMMIDRDGNLWLGLFQRGVMMAPFRSESFRHYGFQPGEDYSIGSGCVMALKSVYNGLWVSIDSDGLYFVDNKGRTEHLTRDVPQTVMGIELAASGELWLAGYSEGLMRLNPETRRVQNFNHLLSEALPNYNRRAVALELDRDESLWVGTYGCGVFKMKKTGEVESFLSSSEIMSYNRNEPINNWINTICAYGANVWMGTYSGMCCYNLDTQHFENIDYELYKVVTGKVVYDICCSDDGLMWIATNNGLVQYDPRSKSVHVYDAHNGLAATQVASVEADKNGMVWAGTYGGLSRIDPASRQIENYYAQDGLQGNEFSRSAVDVDHNGRLFFGGLNGVSAFSPYNLMVSKNELKVAITKFYINGTEANNQTLSDGYQVTDCAVIESNEFTFSCAEKSFGFELSTFNYINPNQVVYEFCLSGFDNTWHALANGSTQLSFTNLPHGHYRLNLRAKMGSNVSALRVVDINIKPMWWQTYWALACYVVLLALVAIYIVRSVRTRRIIRDELVNRQHERNIDEAKFQFFFNISHEIRTPLTLIINPIRELMSEKDVTPDRQRNYNLIYRNAMRILRLINQLLDIRKIEAGQITLHFRHEPLQKFIEQIDQSFISLAEKKKIRSSIVSDLDDDVVDIDVNNFDKVIYNVFSNAYKFTPDGGSISTHLWQEGEMVHIEVTDTGIGISADQAERIFDRFYQAENAQSAEYVGTGIGLHLTRSVVELHGGTISASNRTDQSGTIIKIVIPKKQENAIFAAAEEAAKTEDAELVDVALPEVQDVPEVRHRATSNRRVLVVDDEIDVNNYLMSKLSRLYKVVTCNNGREAYDLLLKEPFDMVISDVMMPEMDGITLCRKMKANININHIPIVLLTAKHSDEDRNHGLVMGADAYIAKPFDIEHLRNTIATIIANRERMLNHVNSIGGEELVAPIRRVSMKSTDETLIEKVNSYIEDNLSDPTLNVERLAAHVGMSRVHMHRKLKELTNQSARDYIRNIRLRQAGILLGEKKLNISDVAYAIGFSNLSHFSSTFKDFYGVSPKDYMNEHIEQTATEQEKERTNGQEPQPKAEA